MTEALLSNILCYLLLSSLLLLLLLLLLILFIIIIIIIIIIIQFMRLYFLSKGLIQTLNLRHLRVALS